MATAGDDSDWIFVSIMWGLFLCMIVASYYEKVFWIAVVLSISMIVAAALFSKFAVGIGILLVLGALGGGPTFVGTFTDRNGNSYDVYKNN